MTAEIDVSIKRGPGRPSKQSIPARTPVYGRQKFDRERSELEQAAAELAERRARLAEREENQRNRCNILLGEGLLRLAESDPAFYDICVKVIDRLGEKRDKDLVSSWMPDRQSSAPTSPPGDSLDEVSPQRPLEKPKGLGSMGTEDARAVTPFSRANPTAEDRLTMTQDGLDLVSAARQSAGARP